MELQTQDTPPWLKKRLCRSEDADEVRKALSEYGVGSICESGRCPNSNECFSKGSVTMLILGSICTRSCGFCAVAKAVPGSIDSHEAQGIKQVARRLGLGYVVITSVTRDDLPDGGSSQFAKVVGMLKDSRKRPIVEVLVPDFKGLESSVKEVLGAGPDVFGHNIETVSRLYPRARPGADYQRSLGVLRLARRLSPGLVTKSGIMVGLGETEVEVIAAMHDLVLAGCDMLTIGQYLRPRAENLKVERFVGPEEFARYRRIGKEIGFKHVESGPFVRSSYLAEEAYNSIREGCDEGCHSAAVS